MSLDTIVLYYVIEDGKDFEFEELLQIVNALEFLELFKNEKVGKNELMACDLNDLISLGISLERAQQLHGDLAKETDRRIEETKRRNQLLTTLKHFNCEELYDDLVKIGYRNTDVHSMDHDVLKKIGLSFLERKSILTKIKDVNDAKVKAEKERIQENQARNAAQARMLREEEERTERKKPKTYRIVR